MESACHIINIVSVNNYSNKNYNYLFPAVVTVTVVRCILYIRISQNWDIIRLCGLLL